MAIVEEKKMDSVWIRLYEEAKKVLHPRKVSECEIKKVIAINWEGKAMPPCGACRELMTQLMPKDYPAIEVMLDWEKREIVTLGELTPKWWI